MHFMFLNKPEPKQGEFPKFCFVTLNKICAMNSSILINYLYLECSVWHIFKVGLLDCCHVLLCAHIVLCRSICTWILEYPYVL